MNERVGVVALVAVVVLAAVGIGVLFSVETGAESPEPAAFDDTVTVGLTLEEQYELLDRPNVSLPRVQTFYSQYEYVVGYWGVDTYLATQRQAGHQARFGYPLATYVTDYGGTGVELSEEGYPVVERDPAWIPADAAWYVVDSEARTPGGETILSFDDRADAERFTDSAGGTVESWAQLTDRQFERGDADAARERVSRQAAAANETVADAAAHDDRPVSVVVGEDAATIQSAIEQAPPNTTVRIPAGTYDETLTIDRPITLAGDGAVTIRGDGNGSVVTITAPEVGVRNVHVTGTGTRAHGAESVPGDEGDHPDDRSLTYYGGADAGISAHVADGTSIVNVSIETRANGVILRESPDAVVKNVTVTEAPDAEDPYAGLLAFYSPAVVEHSTFVGGRDTIYLDESDGLVLRDSEIRDSVLGLHLMHTNDALLADNQVRNVTEAAIYVMTGPTGTAVVGNDVTDAGVGISVGGTQSYVARNTVTDSDLGLRILAEGSLYERNVLAGNEVGAHAGAVLPTNRVTANDFVANDRHATAGHGPLRVWADDGDGNFWQGATSPADGTPPGRAYSPTDPVDRRLHTTPGAATLARAPALDALAGLERSVSGMRSGSITDPAPSCTPNNPDLLARTAWADEAVACDGATVPEP
ncbi:nitrous oxidase accessory protein [Halovivax ruber XH-70]|uniref:Nitrous oxidase accessory protein n=1 Tax=Halovivax ruber (strain DSM 18193 / JCM 13892 / XH-70) TaxID=797302 RepID=L0IFK7_HALRX|nr:NosD domain-containing protein [Halovivax ruber]AGB17549.1 nitrous oxidase accessory protein [Halovivax ruber XH-70]